MDTTALRQAYREFLDVAESGRFGPPQPGEWDAAELLAHIVATDTGITAIALGVAAGQRPGYDNRYALDGWNLSRLVSAAGGVPGLIALVRRRGELLCQIAEQLDPTDSRYQCTL